MQKTNKYIIKSCDYKSQVLISFVLPGFLFFFWINVRLMFGMLRMTDVQSVFLCSGPQDHVLHILDVSPLQKI